MDVGERRRERERGGDRAVTSRWRCLCSPGRAQGQPPVGRALVSGATLWHLALGCPSLQGARRPWARGTGPRLLPAVLRALLVWPAPARDPAMFCGGGCTWASPSLRGTAVGQAPSMPHPLAPKGAALWVQLGPCQARLAFRGCAAAYRCRAPSRSAAPALGSGARSTSLSLVWGLRGAGSAAGGRAAHLLCPGAFWCHLSRGSDTLRCSG